MLLTILNPKKYYFLFIEVINFLRNPHLNENSIGRKNRITNTIILIVIKLILAIIVGLISRIIIWNIGIQTENIGFKNANIEKKKINKYFSTFKINNKSKTNSNSIKKKQYFFYYFFFC